MLNVLDLTSIHPVSRICIYLLLDCNHFRILCRMGLSNLRLFDPGLGSLAFITCILNHPQKATILTHISNILLYYSKLRISYTLISDYNNINSHFCYSCSIFLHMPNNHSPGMSSCTHWHLQCRHRHIPSLLLKFHLRKGVRMLRNYFEFYRFLHFHKVSCMNLEEEFVGMS